MKPLSLPLIMILLAPLGVTAGERPNVLFIMTDQQFGDAMSCRMGDDYIHTPAIDSLAKTGALFTRAYVANPICMPSRNAIFTGLYPHQTGVTRNNKGSVPPESLTSMGTYFKNSGYETAYFGKWHLIYKMKSVSQHGFEKTSDLKRTKYWDTQISSSAVEYLSQQHAKPFLAVVSFHNPHDVCELARGESLPGGSVGKTPPPEMCPPAPANLAPPKGETDSMQILREGYHASRMFPVGKFSADRWRQQRWGYYRLIEKVDREIGRVLTALREGGHEENTVIVFTSDHGECAGAHRFNQKTVFYDESARVPMIISWKGQTKPATSNRLVNTGVDILPTLADFAEVKLPKKLPGRSLRAIAEGKTVSPWRDHIVIQNDMSQSGPLLNIQPRLQGRMVRTDRYKYCVYQYGSRRESLIDMQADPLESTNLAGRKEMREVVEQHRKLLAEFGKHHDDKLVAELLSNDVGPRPFPKLAQ